jgi:hypothetical protein
LTGCQVPFRRAIADKPWLKTMSVIHPRATSFAPRTCRSARLTFPTVNTSSRRLRPAVSL